VAFRLLRATLYGDCLRLHNLTMLTPLPLPTPHTTTADPAAPPDR
jgi:hypothetical protein